MHMGILGIDFHLPGCRSLKEKRQRLVKLRDKFGRVPNIAVCESEFQDSHQRSRWSVIAVAASSRVVEQSLTDVERWIQEAVDAIVIDVTRELRL